MPAPKWKLDRDCVSHALQDGITTVGRCLINTVRLARPQISNVHLIISKLFKDPTLLRMFKRSGLEYQASTGVLMVRDNQSDEGTFQKVNGAAQNLDPSILYRFDLTEGAVTLQIAGK